MDFSFKKPTLSEGENKSLGNAIRQKKLHTETFDEAWTRLMAMKNSDIDNRRMSEVRDAMIAGKIGRESGSESKRLSKAEVFRQWQVLDRMKAQERLRQMVEDMPSNYRLINDKAEFSRLIKFAEKESELVIDVETTGTDIYEDYIVGYVITLVSKDIHAYIPTKHDTNETQLNHDFVTERLKPILENEDVLYIAHNAKFDLAMLRNEGIYIRGRVWDTLEAMKLLNENEPSYALKTLVTKYLREPSLTYGELFGKKGFHEVPLNQATAYAAKDGDVTLKLRDFQRFHLAKMPTVLEYFETVEMPLIPIIVDMEMEGYEIDLEFAKDYGEELRKDSERLYAEIIAVLGDINLNSPIQLKDAIEAHIGREIENTNANQTLKPLSREFAVIKKLLDYREKAKLLSTYIDALPKLIKPKTGRLHTQFNQNGAKTGRFSSGGGGSFNIQNQPSEARRMYVAPRGYLIVNADFSSQEVRIIASESKEDVLLEAFAEGKDAYASLASEFFDKPYEDCYKNADGSDTEERKRMKVVLLMSMYGASKWGLAQALDITPEEAEKFLDDFFKKYRKIDEFIKRTHKFANKHGFVWIGEKQRKRRLPEARGNIRQYDPKRNRAMRQGPNARIQGLAAIQTKKTLIEVDKIANERGWKLFGAIHDEIVVLMPDTSAKEDFEILHEIMTKTHLLDGVENDTDIEVQKRWGDSITLDDYLNGKEVPRF